MDYIVVGQGMAGSVLAYELMGCGVSLRVIDNGYKSSASRVAAGIMSPLTGPRLANVEGFGQFLEEAKGVYRALESVFGVKFFSECEILRLFKNDYEVKQYEKRRLEEGYVKYLGESFEGGFFGGVLRDERGSFVIRGGGHLDTKAFLACFRDFFKEKGSLVEEDFDYGGVVLEDGFVCYNNIRAKKIIFCEGYKVIENPWFKCLRWRPAKGEILTIRAGEVLLSDKIVNCEKWLMPELGGCYRVGATYEWDCLDGEPTESGKEEILGDLCENILMDRHHKIEVIKHEGGVRPCTRDFKPYIGLHPMYSSLGLFNGFGSKAVLLVPYYARQFVGFLEKGMELDKDVLVSRGQL